jgi:DnaJ-class molecular chaperone
MENQTKSESKKNYGLIIIAIIAIMSIFTVFAPDKNVKSNQEDGKKDATLLQDSEQESTSSNEKEIHCIVCDKNLTDDDYDRISPNGNGNYYCTSCYEKTMDDVTNKLQSKAVENYQSVEADNSESQSDYSTGSDGRIYENAPCTLCRGTGIEMSTAPNPATGKWESRVCPQCGGRGHESY